MILDQAQKEKISALIAQSEKKSSAELVAVVAKKSGEYLFLWGFISLSIMFIASFCILLFINIVDIYLFLWTQLFIFSVTIFLFYMYESFWIARLPKKYRYSRAWEFAYKNFHNLGLNRTKTRAGIMFFVSIDEKYVAIITDSAIKERLEDKYWEEIVESFIQDVKNGQIAHGYIRAIESCTKVLAEKFPIQKDDKNELLDEVIELL